MFARVSRWEGGEAEGLRASAEEAKKQVQAGPPPGVPAVGYTMLVDPESGRSLAIGLFATEEDMRKGDETLNSMSPTTDGVGKRTSVEMYEVGAEIRL